MRGRVSASPSQPNRRSSTPSSSCKHDAAGRRADSATAWGRGGTGQLVHRTRRGLTCILTMAWSICVCRVLKSLMYSIRRTVAAMSTFESVPQRNHPSSGTSLKQHGIGVVSWNIAALGRLTSGGEAKWHSTTLDVEALDINSGRLSVFVKLSCWQHKVPQQVVDRLVD